MRSGTLGVKGKFAAIFVLAMLIFAGQAFSGTITIFGPKVFNKDKGAPVTYTEGFTIPPGVGNFQLLVKNGANGSGEVKNVSVSINGVEIISSSDLRQSPMSMKQITLQPENEIRVTLKGQGDNAIFVRLDGEPLITDPVEPAPIRPLMPE